MVVFVGSGAGEAGGFVGGVAVICRSGVAGSCVESNPLVGVCRGRLHAANSNIRINP